MKERSRLLQFGFLLCVAALFVAADEPSAPTTPTETVSPKETRIYNVRSPYDEVTWMDVVAKQQKPPSADSIQIWFNYRDLSPSANVSAVWYRRAASRLERLGESPIGLGERALANAFLAPNPGRTFPNGNYEVWFYVDGQLDNQYAFVWNGARTRGAYGAVMMDGYSAGSSGKSPMEEAVDTYIPATRDEREI